MNLGRSKIGKKENQKHDLKVPCMQLDKLSGCKKKRIMENLAKIQKDGTVEVDVARRAQVASELFELDVCDTRQDDLEEEGEEQCKPIPKLNIAMLVVGTRGDVQPFVAVAKRLQEYGHRVRLATHANFHSFVTSAGIEFYPIGGDPRALAEYMARNKGFLPSGPSEISFPRRQLKAIVNSLFPACIEPDTDSGLPFRAQAIIANPPAYGLVVGTEWASLRILVLSEDAVDWGNLVDVVGFCFLNLGSNYSPQQKFLQWLQAGPKPVYVGFGSTPLEDSSKITNIIIEALERTGQRGIIDKGWGNLGNFCKIPDYVFLVEDCPHDWLFHRCTAVVHHGGAGTTAAGLRAGCPTTIVPFIGDQLFWANRVHAKGVGPPPIPIGQLTTEALADAIRTMLDPQVKLKAIELRKQIQEEDGVVSAVNVFHKHLPRELPKPEAPPDPPSFLKCLLLTLERWFCLPCIT